VCKVSAANEHTPQVPLAVLSNAVQRGSGQALFERSEFAPDPALRE